MNTLVIDDDFLDLRLGAVNGLDLLPVPLRETFGMAMVSASGS
jgi:hypothetical protein